MTADDTDEVQLVFGDDAPAEVHAAWAAVEPRNTAGASAPAACAPGGRSPAPASGADADAHADAGASAAAASGEAPDEAATEAQAALVARLVAALSGAVFDCGDARGVALSGGLMCQHTHQADSSAIGAAVQLVICLQHTPLRLPRSTGPLICRVPRGGQPTRRPTGK